MYINASLLFEELKKSFSLTCFGNSDTGSLYLPLIYRRGTKILPNHIYVGNGGDFDANAFVPPNCCIVSSGNLPESYTTGSACCIVASEGTETSLLLNEIQTIFESFNRWRSQLEDMVRNNCGMQEFLDKCQPYFPGNFLLILDSSWYVLATTGPRNFVMDSTGHTPAEVLTRFKKDPNYVEMHFNREPFLYRGLYFDHDILICNIIIGDEVVGKFSLAEQTEPITAGKIALFSQLLNLVVQLYQMHFFVNISEMHPISVISKVLNGSMVSRDELNHSVGYINWEPGDEYIACVILIHESDKRIRSVSYLRKHIETIMPYALVMEYNNDIIIIFNRTRDHDKEESSKQEFHTFLKESMLRVGYSRPFRDLLQLKDYCSQAKAALEICGENSSVPCCYFNDHILSYMLKNVCGDIAPETLFPSGLLELDEHDKKHGSSYIKTLDTYFKTGFNASQASKKLYINRSTFLARMKKICDTLELSLEKYDDLLYLMLCLKLFHL